MEARRTERQLRTERPPERRLRLRLVKHRQPSPEFTFFILTIVLYSYVATIQTLKILSVH